MWNIFCWRKENCVLDFSKRGRCTRRTIWRVIWLRFWDPFDVLVYVVHTLIIKYLNFETSVQESYESHANMHRMDRKLVITSGFEFKHHFILFIVPLTIRMPKFVGNGTWMSTFSIHESEYLGGYSFTHACVLMFSLRFYFDICFMHGQKTLPIW